MKITKVEAIPFKIPMRKEVGVLKSAVVTMNAAEHVLVSVVTDCGVTGYAEAHERPTIYGETQASITKLINHYIGPAITGMDVCDTEKILDKMDKYGSNYTAKGALDTAVHDALTKILGIPMYKYFGGFREPKAKAVAPISIYPPEETAEKAMDMRERYGVMGFKLKAGIDPGRDIAAVRAVREALGAEAVIYVDANQGYSPDVAIRTIRKMEESDIAWVEEPVRKDDFVGKAKVGQNIGVPILLDESVWTPQEVMNNLRMGLGGIISIKAVRTGCAKSRKIAMMAEAANIPCITGTGRDSSLGAVVNAHIVAGFKNVLMGELTDFTVYEASLIQEEIRLEDGYFYLPEGAGLGVSIDESVLNKYRLDV